MTIIDIVIIFLLPHANEVCEGYVFTRVCHSVHRGEGGACWSWAGVWSRGMGSGSGGVPGQGGGVLGGDPPPHTATAVGSTHPTGMHSCLHILSNHMGNLNGTHRVLVYCICMISLHIHSM